jgi:uncharacterized membrane protein
MTRPKEIVWFERGIIASLFLGAINSWLAWPELVALGGMAFLITIQIFTFAIMIGLTLFVSRRRSNVAKWILVALFVIGTPMWLKNALAGLQPGSPLILFAQFAVQVVAYILLFTAASRSWLKGQTEPASA